MERDNCEDDQCSGFAANLMGVMVEVVVIPDFVRCQGEEVGALCRWW